MPIPPKIRTFAPDKAVWFMKSDFDKDVAIQAILYVAGRIGQRKDMHKIFKVLYFADRMHISKYGRSITGDTYIAMAYGPVPSNIDDIFKAVRGDSYFSDCADEFRRSFRFENKYIIKPLRDADMDYLSESDTECLDHAISLCRDKSFDELVSMSHDLAWNNTNLNRAISVKDIIREAGDDEEYAEYISHKLELKRAFL